MLAVGISEGPDGPYIVWGYRIACGPDDLAGKVLAHTAVPCLDDAATIGALTRRVREAVAHKRGADHCAACALHTPTGWGVVMRYGTEGFVVLVLPVYASEGEALIAALEVAT